MPKEKPNGLEALGGLVFSTDRNMDLSPQEPEQETPAPGSADSAQYAGIHRDAKER